MAEKILLFIPAYNCEKQIPRVLEQVDADVLALISGIIVVNNRSTDGTESAVIAYAKNHSDLPLKLMRNHENYGLGGSHKVAFLYALENGFDTIIVLHGDDQGSIQNILPLLKNKDYQNYDCCLGARFKRGARLQGYSRFRTFGNRVYNALFSVVTGRRIYDLGAGLNLYHTRMLRNGYYLKFPDDLTFNYCMVLALAHYRQSALFFPILWREEDQVSNVKLMTQAGYVLGLAIKYFFLRGKLVRSEFRSFPRNEYGTEVIYENET
jgi:glycosyltransferase involved in cell wall biosynthesis